jgi:hypothetical protein
VHQHSEKLEEPPRSELNRASSAACIGVAGIPTGPGGPHGPPPVGPPGPHPHPHPGSVAAAQLEAAERLALATDPMVRLQMAGISPEYHAHTHAHTHAHSHTHLHLHPSQQAQAQQEAAAAASGTPGFPLPGESRRPSRSCSQHSVSTCCRHCRGTAHSMHTTSWKLGLFVPTCVEDRRSYTSQCPSLNSLLPCRL